MEIYVDLVIQKIKLLPVNMAKRKTQTIGKL